MTPQMFITLLCALAMGVLVGFIGHELTGSFRAGAASGLLVGMPLGTIMGAMLGARTGA